MSRLQLAIEQIVFARNYRYPVSLAAATECRFQPCLVCKPPVLPPAAGAPKRTSEQAAARGKTLDEGGSEEVMGTYLLTYNPRNYPWPNLAEDAEKSARGVPIPDKWNAKNKRITRGDRVFLLKQGRGRTGIMAVGRVTSEPYPDEHWDEGKAARGYQRQYIRLEFERILNPATERLLWVADRKGHLATLFWDTRFSGRHIPDDAAMELEALWRTHLAQFGLTPKSANAAENLKVNPPEKVLRAIRKRKGQPDFRQALLSAYGGRCCITKCDAEPALEAAHIIGYAESGIQDTRCGLLLRADIHTLFDLKLIRVNPETMRVVLAESLKATSYGELHNRKITVPDNPADDPTPALWRKWRDAKT